LEEKKLEQTEDAFYPKVAGGGLSPSEHVGSEVLLVASLDRAKIF
jgi:hypothetical protein